MSIKLPIAAFPTETATSANLYSLPKEWRYLSSGGQCPWFVVSTRACHFERALPPGAFAESIAKPVSILARSFERALPRSGCRSWPNLSVSILARSFERALQGPDQSIGGITGVSILARSFERALPGRSATR